MKHVGERALPFRLPALDGRGMTLIDPDTFWGRWVVLSFVSGLQDSDAVLWDEQGKRMKGLGAPLLVVPVEANTLHETCHLGAWHFRIVGDPLRRLERLYGGRRLLSAGRARTFLIDAAGILRFHVVHSISARGMGIVTELLETYQADDVPRERHAAAVSPEGVSPVLGSHQPVSKQPIAHDIPADA